MAHLKRIAMPRHWPLKGKGMKFIVNPRGPHKTQDSLPLGVIVRDILNLANSMKEAKKIINNGGILVNNRVIKDEKFSVGLFDKISIPKINKYFEIFLLNKKITVREIKEVADKVFKIVGKKILNKGKVQLNLSSGVNILLDNKLNVKIKIGDSVLIKLKDLKIEKHLPLEKGSYAVVTAGKNIGKEGVIIYFEKRKNGKVIIKEKDGKEIISIIKNIFVIK